MLPSRAWAAVSGCAVLDVGGPVTVLGADARLLFKARLADVALVAEKRPGHPGQPLCARQPLADRAGLVDLEGRAQVAAAGLGDAGVAVERDRVAAETGHLRDGS